jgi:hypothetical protein
MSVSSRPRAAFYCVSSGVYFLGAVGLINSLRLQGHAEPIFLLDCGLTASQRELLSPHVTLVPAPADAPPYLLKTFAPMRHPAAVMVLIDVDMIVTRPLTELIEMASRGQVLAVENQMDRFVPEWGDLLDLGPIRRQPYLSSGLVLLGGSVGEAVLRLMDDRQRQVEYELGYLARNVPDYPFLYLDQDVLNAILATRLEADRLVALDSRLAPVPPFAGLRITNEKALSCSYEDGVEPYVVHQYLPLKPWLEAVYDGAYSQLLRRSLAGPDVAVRVPRPQIPLRMRTGPLAYAERRLINAREQLRWRLGGLVRQLGARVETRRRRGAVERL